MNSVIHYPLSIIHMPELIGTFVKWQQNTWNPARILLPMGRHLSAPTTPMKGVGLGADECIAFNSRAFAGQFGVPAPDH